MTPTSLYQTEHGRLSISFETLVAMLIESALEHGRG